MRVSNMSVNEEKIVRVDGSDAMAKKISRTRA